MNEKDCELLLELYKIKNITKVSQKLFITQPAISKRIQKMEEELGCQLLLRSNKGVVFTPAGEAIMPSVGSILHASRLMREQAAAAAAENVVCGSLHLGVSIDYAYYRLPAILKTYTERYPRVDAHVITGKSRNLIRMLRQEELPIAILRGEYAWNEGCRLLSTESVYLVCSNENKGRPLTDYPYIGRHTDPFFMQEIQRWKKERGLSEMNTKLWFDNILSCREIIRCGIGWAILPDICLADFDGCKEALTFADGTPFIRNTYLLYKEPYDQLPQVQAFFKML